MKIDGKFDYDNNINDSRITNLVSFLNTFGTVNYKIGDNWLSQKMNTERVKPKNGKDSAIYIEVPNELKNATEINFTFNIRNLTYKYILK